MAIQEFFDQYDPIVASLALKVRTLIFEVIPDVTEEVDVAAKMVAYSLGPGYTGMICTIIPSKKGVKLGFYRGSELPDPARLLTGTGKVHRYVELDSEKVAGTELRKLVKAAIKAHESRQN